MLGAEVTIVNDKNAGDFFSVTHETQISHLHNKDKYFLCGFL